MWILCCALATQKWKIQYWPPILLLKAFLDPFAEKTSHCVRHDQLSAEFRQVLQDLQIMESVKQFYSQKVIQLREYT